VTPKTVIVIPARYESKRFAGKALAEIRGKPLIEHVYRRAQKVRGVEQVLVATDDRRIQDCVEAFGGRAVISAAAHRCGSERVAEAAEALEADIVVNLQGDEPLIHPGSIEQVIQSLDKDPLVPMATLKTPIREERDLHDPNVVKVVTARNGLALYFSRSPIPYRGWEPRHHAYKHIGVYAYRKDFLPRFAALEQSELEKLEKLEQLRALEHGFRILVAETRHDSIAVNTEKDLERVVKAMAGSEEVTPDSGAKSAATPRA
jgi:3-deoxy-manno-octulosonate cytidylyltransferase (CMP-KDO synthetase)